MLLHKFFDIINEESEEGKTNVTVRFNPSHPIFEGHFPGQPVVPGVCMLQMIKELIERQTGKQHQLQSAPSCKFLNLIDPTKSPEVTISLSLTDAANAETSVQATIVHEATTFLKLNAVFVEVGEV